ncbi:hypothetical protein PMPD1_4432 (plasmid) [Paramixta manurensis]|uniref:Chromosome partitioning protein ParB n=1 Tax=Paramixta manurensis TaxID=2740817 RepID=A0A6M8UND3_9GAMM|nr:hypothetical protein PMPD1_4432 [Erwiniaceae bacterium PD-1]
MSVTESAANAAKKPKNTAGAPKARAATKAVAAALTEAGHADAVPAVSAMKKGAASVRAAELIAGTRWVPGWMTAAAQPAAEDDNEPTGPAVAA